MNNKLLWEPVPSLKEKSNMALFMKFVNGRWKTGFSSYDALYEWSIENISDFWAAVWDFVEVKASRKYDKVVDDLSKFPGAGWFPGARLNFAENLLRYKDDRIAFIFKEETHKSAQITYAELYASVARLAASLRKIGIKPGDRVSAYMPNLMETAIAMLASNSLGAIWASCATDLGAQATIDRLGQIKPRVLFTAEGYFYKGKNFSSLKNAAEIARGIPSLEKVIVVHYTGEKADISNIPNSVYYDKFILS